MCFALIALLVGTFVACGDKNAEPSVVEDEIEDNSDTHEYAYDQYLVTLDANGGSISSDITFFVAWGDSVTFPIPTRFGYTFVGWTYNGSIVTGSDGKCTWTLEDNLTLTLTAQWEIAEGLLPFECTITDTTCTITGIKDKTVTNIVVPDYVTKIAGGAFSGCSSLKSITIPFAGNQIDGTKDKTNQYPFGYIFGRKDYAGGEKVEQYYRVNERGHSSVQYSPQYYIPSSLQSVTITGRDILTHAFANCSMLTSITIGENVTSIGSSAFVGCYRIVEVYNKSTINITKGDDDVSAAGRYAKAIYTSPTSANFPPMKTDMSYIRMKTISL